MRKIVAFALITMFIYGCVSYDLGNLTGIRTKVKRRAEKPLGMVLIPDGAVTVSNSDPIDNTVTKKTVSVGAFYMDATEITNREYKQFINWVKDSIVRAKLAEQAEIAELFADNPKTINTKRGIYRYAYLKKKEPNKKIKLSIYDQYMYDYYYYLNDFEENKEINSNVRIIWDPQRFPDVDYVEVMDSLYLRKEETLNGVRRFDPAKLNYTYKAVDGIKKELVKTINIYPDTTVWVKDFKKSYTYPMLLNYFSNPAYLDYPVVGVTWEQAMAFCDWRTMYKNNFLEKKNKSSALNVPRFRLPTESEWELAAKGGKNDSIKYSWGINKLTAEAGCFLANFKPKEGNYVLDKGLYTVDAKHYLPNEYGLYNMSGNVAEWTSTSYGFENEVESSDINPFSNDITSVKKVIKGGSWKDVIYYLEIGSRDVENKDLARSFIGFRTVQGYIKTN